MRRYLRKFGEAFRKGDLVLLFMCMALNIFGMLMIASTTYQVGPLRYLSPRVSRLVWAFSCTF